MHVDVVTAGGIACLRRHGGGLPFVLLHGIGSAKESFLPVIAALGGAPALAWDMPGYGGSAAAVPDWPTADDYAAALAGLLDAQGIARCVLVGHSLGVVTALRFARRHPARVTALACCSPALGYGIAPGAALPQGVQTRLDDLDRLGPGGLAAARAARLVHAPEQRPEVLAAVRDAMGRVRPEGYRRASRLLAGADALADAADLRLACLVAGGEADVVTPPANAERLAAALATAGCTVERLMLPGVGHALPQEQPSALADALRALAARAGG